MITEKTKKQILGNIRKAKGMLEKIEKMIEQDIYCVEIMQQNLAVIGLLKGVHRRIMEDHLKSCFLEGMESGSGAKRKKMVEEILKVTDLYNK